MGLKNTAMKFLFGLMKMGRAAGGIYPSASVEIRTSEYYGAHTEILCGRA